MASSMKRHLCVMLALLSVTAVPADAAPTCETLERQANAGLQKSNSLIGRLQSTKSNSDWCAFIRYDMGFQASMLKWIYACKSNEPRFQRLAESYERMSRYTPDVYAARCDGNGRPRYSDSQMNYMRELAPQLYGR